MGLAGYPVAVVPPAGAGGPAGPVKVEHPTV